MCKMCKIYGIYVLTILCSVFGLVGAVEELAVEELNADHGEYEKKEHVNDKNVEYIFERNDNTVKHSL